MKLVTGFNISHFFEHRHQLREIKEFCKSGARTVACPLRGEFDGGGGFTKSRCPRIEMGQPFLLECAVLQIAHDRV